MIEFTVDFIYVLAGLAAVLNYKSNENIAQFAKVAAAYAFIAILFQFGVHCFERIQKNIK